MKQTVIIENKEELMTKHYQEGHAHVRSRFCYSPEGLEGGDRSTCTPEGNMRGNMRDGDA